VNKFDGKMEPPSNLLILSTGKFMPEEICSKRAWVHRPSKKIAERKYYFEISPEISCWSEGGQIEMSIKRKSEMKLKGNPQSVEEITNFEM
jgi:hypothetical protein